MLINKIFNDLLNKLSWLIAVPTVLIVYLYFFQPDIFRVLSNLAQQKIQVGDAQVSIDQIKTIAELATVVSYHQAVVPIRETNEFSGIQVGETSLIYIASAQVSVGFDLSKLTAANLETQGGSNKLLMPPPKILSITLIPDKSQIWNKEKQWIAPDSEAELVLEAQTKAIDYIQKDVCSGTVLDMASINASILISNLFLNEGVALSVQPEDWTVADCLKKP